MQLLAKTNVAAHIFGTTRTNLYKWRDLGAPGIGHGKVDVVQFLPWWLENINSSSTEDEDKTLSGAKLQYWQAKAEKEEVLTSVLKEKYVAKEEIGKQWSYRAGVYKSHLLAFASRVPPLLEGKSQLEMREIMTVEAIDTLSAVTKNEKYCPKDALSKDFLCEKPKKSKKKRTTSGRKK